MTTLLRPRLPTLTDPDAAVLRDLLIELGVQFDDPAWGSTADLRGLADLIWSGPLVRPIAIAALAHRMPRILWHWHGIDRSSSDPPVCACGRGDCDNDPYDPVGRTRWERIAFELAIRAVLLGGPEVALIDTRRVWRDQRREQIAARWPRLTQRPGTLVYVRAKQRGESMRGWVGSHAGPRYLMNGRPVAL